MTPTTLLTPWYRRRGRRPGPASDQPGSVAPTAILDHSSPAILESAARGLGIATRARALLVGGSFWYPRFPHARFAVPDQVMLVWPEFAIAGEWRTASALFGAIGCRGGGGFRNAGAETLFEAVGRCAVDWDGGDDPAGPYDLSRFVRAELGCFADRDEVFARFGQTLCAPSRALADPILRRIAA